MKKWASEHKVSLPTAYSNPEARRAYYDQAYPGKYEGKDLPVPKKRAPKSLGAPVGRPKKTATTKAMTKAITGQTKDRPRTESRPAEAMVDLSKKALIERGQGLKDFVQTPMNPAEVEKLKYSTIQRDARISLKPAALGEG